MKLKNFPNMYRLLILLLIILDVLCLSPPSFSILPKDKTVALLYAQVSLPCSANGSPQPKVVNWLKNDKPVNFGSSLYKLRASGELFITRASKEDSAQYQCVAQNSVGGMASEKRELVVAYFDRLTRPETERITKKEKEYFQASPPSTIKCHPKPKYIWKKGDETVVEDSRISISKEGDLFISNLQYSDSGRYKLIVENTDLITNGVQFAGQEARVIVLNVLLDSTPPPNRAKIMYVSKKQIAGELKTSMLTLECFITGININKVNIAWKRKNKENRINNVPVSSKYIRRYNGRRLDIKNPTYKDDNGIYMCVPMVGSNADDSKDIQVEVYSVPKFIVNPKNVDGFTDNSTSIDCRTIGYPSHVKRWYRNGIPVVPSQNYVILPNNTLVIKMLNWEDAGAFQCGAENFAALKFSQLEAKVQNISARIDNTFRDIYVGYGTTVIVPCVVVGAPKPVVYWTLNATRIRLPRPKYTLFDNGSLEIENMDDTESGVYECVADNRINIARKRLKVWAVVATVFLKVPERETMAQSGANIRLPCEVKHDSNINYTREWRHNNLAVKNPRYVVNERDGSLTILFAQAADTGIDFSCHIFSSGGNISVATALVLVQLPREPSSPRATEIQAYALRLTWDAPSDGGSPLIEYHLFMKNFTMSDFFLLAKPPASSASFMVNNLRAGSKYKFKVGATNKFGRGDLSFETDWIQTKTLAPSAAPYGLQSVSAGMDSVTLAWVIPASRTHNGRLLGFSIGYRLASSSSDFARIDIKSGTATSYIMFGLPLFTRYEIRIAAYNQAGLGPWSSIQFVETKQGIPSLPPTNVSVSVINDTSVKVNFASPPQEFWNGKLIEIIARTWPPEQPQSQKEYRTVYDRSSLKHQTFVLPHLEADTEYTLAVAVATTGGPSPGSATVQFKTSEGVPGAVRDLQILGIYSDAFSVSWKPPLETSGQLRGYNVRYRRFGVGNWEKFTELPLARGAVISPLQANTRYEVAVAAFTVIEAGPETSASVTTIQSPVLPSAPSNLKSYSTWGTVISLGWTPGNSGRAVILHYIIEYNNDTDYRRNPKAAVWRTVRNLTKILENPANLTYLKPSTTYRFRMTAYNRVGASPVSNVSDDITTGEGIPSKPPTGVFATAPEVQTLLVKWTPPSKDSWNSGSIKYQFLIKPKGQDPKIKTPYLELPDTQATSYFARGLQKYTMYNITMRLFNDKGFGPWTKPYFARTSEDFPSGAPTKVTAKFIDSSSIQVNWGPVPEYQRNGAILGYKIHYKMKGVPDTELFKDISGNETFTGIIQNLAGFTDYEIQLSAYTKVGGRFKSNPVTEKTDRGLPGKPRDIRFNPVTYSLITVKWNSPARPNGDILFYEVRYKRNISGSVWKTHEETVGAFVREAYIKALTFNAFYVFEIRAKSAAGWGKPAQEILMVTTDRQMPESPVILAIPLSSVRTYSVVIRWRSRYNGNSPIRAYNLQYNKEFGGWQTYRYGIPPMDNIPANINELEVLKLEPATSYQFRVRAINDVGPSTWSDVSRRQTTHPKVTNGAPYNVRVISKTPTSMLLGWEPPKFSVLTGQLRGYKIKYKLLAGISDFTEVSLSSSKLDHRISNLKIFQAYEVRVGAFNGEGKGTWTPSYVWRTGEASPLTAPTNVKATSQGSGKIRVQWTLPNLDSVRGYTLGFKIESIRLEGKRRKRRSLRQKRDLTAICTYIPASQTHLAGPYSTEVTLKNLRKYTRYSITVRVYNTYGDGPRSRAVTFTTPKDVPGPPYILSERVYTDLIAIDFAKPCEPNGQILGYKVEYRENRGNLLPPIVYDKNELRIQVKGLKPNTYYLLELSARTSVGYGQKATIDFYTKQGTRPPMAPGAPSIYENKPAVLTLQWEEGDNGNMPVTRFYLRYRIAKGPWTEYRAILANEIRYDDAMAVYSILGLKNDETYYFQVKSQTALGTSQYSEASKPIRTPAPLSGDKPIYQKMWFIFLIIIIGLLIIIATAVCCWYHQCRKDKYKTSQPPYSMSSFEMAMVRNGRSGDSESGRRLLPESRNGSIAPSIASSKKPKRNDGRKNSLNSIAKSYDISDNDADKSSETETEYERHRSRRGPPEASIANHYSHDPFHKNWRDSMDKKTKKEILTEFGRRPSSGSIDEKKRTDSEERLNRPRPRPGRPDIVERKKLARSEPFLDQNVDSFHPRENQQEQHQHRPTRPGKRQVNRDLARSEPDLNRPPGPPDSQVTRASSFLRATGGDSDNESFQEVLEREKTKREMAMDFDNRMDSYYPNAAPPPYEWSMEHGAAPPAYSPSDHDGQMSDDLPSEVNYPIKNRPPYVPPKPRLSDYSDSSDGRRPSSNRSYNPPSRQDRGYFSPEREYPPERGFTPRDGRSPNPNYVPEPSYAPQDRFSPPQSRFDDEIFDDGIDDYEPDMTLV